ncbi:50S ribosomal protein L37ae [Candidatus Nanohalococcus occultus]|uniref:50S ribosomal protein L37Ae n=1 Tax=Candidatus Nanohalococcus occultus TaxID=2978047 RepID=A0ABY8CIF1_9ARCH|nr:Ribosomal protein L37AE/L43A [Candidatus Nanohaloarchaeota archaeon SVXNc]
MPRKNTSSKRFGSRYGSKIRRNVDEAESKEEGYERVAAGVWKDKETGKKVAGGAYKVDTGAEETMKKALQVETEELEEAKEAIEDDE